MITLILLAGGTGTRMGTPLPKQYLPLNGKPIALHSLELLSTLPEITQIIIVCDPAYRSLFPSTVQFATPGPRRQDSVYSGLLHTTQEIVLIHDAARPFLELPYLLSLLNAVYRTGAAALAAPITSTIKHCDANHLVTQTLDRSHLWEIQTPQALRRSLLLQAFDHVHAHNLTVTDDISLAEALGHPAEIVPCSPRNIKITTPFDLAVAQTLCAIN